MMEVQLRVLYAGGPHSAPPGRSSEPGRPVGGYLRPSRRPTQSASSNPWLPRPADKPAPLRSNHVPGAKCLRPRVPQTHRAVQRLIMPQMAHGHQLCPGQRQVRGRQIRCPRRLTARAQDTRLHMYSLVEPLSGRCAIKNAC